MSLQASVGPELNLLEETPNHAHQLVMPQPVLQNHELRKLRGVDHYVFDTETLDCTWPVAEGPGRPGPGGGAALRRRPAAAVGLGVTILILSDRAAGARAGGGARRCWPSPPSTTTWSGGGPGCGPGSWSSRASPARCTTSPVCSATAPAPSTPTSCSSRCPAMIDCGELPAGMTAAEAAANVVAGIGKGLLKVLSKMGISTIQSYTGAQIFEAVGLDADLVDRHFTGTASRIGGVGLDVLAREALDRHARAYPAGSGAAAPPGRRLRLAALRRGAPVEPRRRGQLQRACASTRARQRRRRRRSNAIKDGGSARAAYAEFARLANEDNGRRATLRGLLRFREAPEPIPLEEVEPAAEIVKRFATGAMSLGSISPESHETLAIAMNRIGGRSNSGEGGEDPRRLVPDDNGDRRRSAIRQVASARFGVTASATWPTPTSSRSRWPRAPSPARAASCPATRSATTSPSCATRPPAWS